MSKIPVLISCEKPSLNQVILNLSIPEDMFWFQGHFPEYPILPGVTQVHWVMHYAQIYFPHNLQFAGMERVKFQDPIAPKTNIQLTLTWEEKLNKLSFEFRSDQSIKSQGKVKFQ